MFSLQPSDELVFRPPNPSKGNEIPEDLIMEPETNYISFSTPSPKTNSGLTRRQTHHDNIKRRAFHRDMERRRRKEMSNLHLTLSSLLPPEYKKGKSAVYDQMQEASNYIKSMQNKIKELRIRRHDLSENKVVTINLQLLGGGMMEILIKTDDVYFGLSRALEVVEETGLDVVNCVSTRTNGIFLHKIHIQGRDMNSLNVSVLQQKLSNAMK